MPSLLRTTPALLVLLLIGVPGVGEAQSPDPLPEYELSQTTWIEHFDVSPDGRHVSFKSARGGVYNVWRVSMEGGEPRQLTFH